MFSKTETYTRLESELNLTLLKLRGLSPSSDEYEKILSIAERLQDMMRKNNPSFLSKDALLSSGTNLLGILMILKHEWLNPINSKALSFVMRVR